MRRLQPPGEAMKVPVGTYVAVGAQQADLSSGRRTGSERRIEFAALEALDTGKPIRDARAVDVPGSYEMFRYVSGWATRLNGETVPVSAPGNLVVACTLREPVGVVGQDHPMEFPR